MNKKEWRRERDDRTLRYAGRVLNPDRWITITAPLSYVRRYDGQVALLTAANLLGRMSPSIVLSFPDAPVHSALPWSNHSLHEVILAQMRSADPYGGFQLLLPDDDDELDERTEALGDWCLGFVYGLAAGGLSEDSELPEDTRELLMDFIEISRASNDVGELDDDSDEEEDEHAFVEIVEYVRTGVLLINEELQPLQTSQIIH